MDMATATMVAAIMATGTIEATVGAVTRLGVTTLPGATTTGIAIGAMGAASAGTKGGRLSLSPLTTATF